MALAAAVLLAHGLLIGRLGEAPGPTPGKGSHSPSVPVLTVRQLPAPADARVPTAQNAVPAPKVSTNLHSGSAGTATSQDTRTPTRRSARTTAPGAGPWRPAAVLPPAAPAPVDGETPIATAATPPPPVAAPPPLYATRPPPPLALHYAVSRGGAAGRATLHWRPSGSDYSLTLESQLGGAPAAGAASEGRLGTSGLAPGRYTESRRGRDLRAVNFQPDSGRITFSRPAPAQTWLPGAQDRLSWMLQLPAVLEAEPALARPGAELRLLVAGTWGGAEVWSFIVSGPDDVDTPAGPVGGALHLRRSPTRPYDTQVDVWLDPARGHLPVRLRWQGQPAGVLAEWWLEALDRP